MVLFATSMSTMMSAKPVEVTGPGGIVITCTADSAEPANRTNVGFAEPRV
jgi:hypothetical protein